TDGQRELGADGARDHLVHPQHVGPQLLVAVRLESEDLLALCHELRGQPVVETLGCVLSLFAPAKLLTELVCALVGCADLVGARARSRSHYNGHCYRYSFRSHVSDASAADMSSGAPP